MRQGGSAEHDRTLVFVEGAGIGATSKQTWYVHHDSDRVAMVPQRLMGVLADMFASTLVFGECRLPPTPNRLGHQTSRRLAQHGLLDTVAQRVFRRYRRREIEQCRVAERHACFTPWAMQ